MPKASGGIGFCGFLAMPFILQLRSRGLSELHTYAPVRIIIHDPPGNASGLEGDKGDKGRGDKGVKGTKGVVLPRFGGHRFRQR